MVTVAAWTLVIALAFGALPARASHGGQPTYTDLDSGSKAEKDGSLKLSVNAAGSIPRFPDSYINTVPVFGYAWADLDTGQAVVVTIHPVIGRDSHQNPDAWHTHSVAVSPGESFNFCVASVGTSEGGISIRSDVLTLNIEVSQAGVSATALDVVASFEVRPDAACLGTGLGVVVLHTATF